MESCARPDARPTVTAHFRHLECWLNPPNPDVLGGDATLSVRCMACDKGYTLDFQPGAGQIVATIAALQEHCLTPPGLLTRVQE